MPDENLIPPERSILNPPPQLKPQERYFIEHFMVVGNLDEIPPIWSSYPAELCQELWERPHVRAEIGTRLEQQQTANARQKAKAKKLEPDFLKAHIVENIENSEPGSQKTKALELGCIVTGVIAKGEKVQEASDKPTFSPVYRSLTIRRITEEVTQTQELPAAMPARALPVADVEILDY